MTIVHVFILRWQYDRGMILKNIGNNIVFLRKKLHLRQIDLATALEIDCSYLSGIENGKRNLSVLLLNDIATVLEVPIQDLFKEKI